LTFFDNAYEGTPTWDIGRPQGAVGRLAQAGLIEGSVLDVGCGTGENALFLAGLGHEVVGIDLARAAIEKARAKAVERGVGATFEVRDALDLLGPGLRARAVGNERLRHRPRRRAIPEVAGWAATLRGHLGTVTPRRSPLPAGRP
jgi:2-polyprenyl-3-methyl-5-hydroxy-6-metoxy-1,4-benzoquinol methylase